MYVSLSHFSQLTSFKGYLTKKELIDAAQELCDSSFTIVSTPGGGGGVMIKCMICHGRDVGEASCMLNTL